MITSTTKFYSHSSLQSIISNPASFNINFGGIQGITEYTRYLRDSDDSKISKIGIQTRSGNCSRSERKYSSSQRHNGHTSTERQDFGMTNFNSGRRKHKKRIADYDGDTEKYLADIIDVEIRKKKPTTNDGTQIRFVTEGDIDHAAKSQQHFIFDRGSEWNMRVDLTRSLCLERVKKILRPYTQEKLEEAYQQKKEKYTELMKTCREREVEKRGCSQ
ncbi:Hypothetical predicted protein [Mytilus galloprovincialis]|uniref:Uncharacterized protein n=1 Tax=Mytilus galloprovincialis TaxID=29158 RepID=A0A8B6EDD5_MYTGA|nr:Hypothetical predicted protein [Mytilus galloprovincialis]